MEDENELYGLESDYVPEEEYTEDEEPESGLSSVPSVGGLRSELFKRLLEREKKASETEQQDFNTVLSTIEQAKQRLLAQPTKGEELRNIAMRLTQPRKESDPRFYERRNLYTFLRDIGEYGGEQAEARKEAEAKALQLDQLAAKYRMERAQKEGSQARQLMAQYFKEPAAKTERQSEFERLIAGLPEDEQKRMRLERAKVMSSRAPKTGKDDEGLTIPQLRSIRVDVAATLDGPKERLNIINEGLSNLNLAIQGNPQAEAQLNRSLATISGDKQLSMAEVESIVGAGSFAQRVGNSISKFFTGGAGDLTNEQKKELLETYEAYHANRYNSARNRLKRIYAAYEGIPEETFDAPYVSVAEKRRRKAEEEARKKADEDKSGSAGITLSTKKTVRPVD